MLVRLGIQARARVEQQKRRINNFGKEKEIYPSLAS